MSDDIQSVHPDRAFVMATIDDALHLNEEDKRRIVASYPAHEREARTKGIPSLGSGAIFPVADESILVDDFAIPDHWPQIVGVDFGWDHPFGATRNAWDRDNDIWYVAAAYSQSEATPPIHAAAIRAWGDWIPIAWPADGHQTEKGTGKALREQYVEQGLNMLADHATFEDASQGSTVSVEAGVTAMLTRMQTGRWKVFRSANAWMAEKRLYHRKDGKIVKLKDDVISASRYGYVMRRFAETKPTEKAWGAPKQWGIV